VPPQGLGAAHPELLAPPGLAVQPAGAEAEGQGLVGAPHLDVAAEGLLVDLVAPVTAQKPAAEGDREPVPVPRRGEEGVVGGVGGQGQLKGPVAAVGKYAKVWVVLLFVVGPGVHGEGPDEAAVAPDGVA